LGSQAAIIEAIRGPKYEDKEEHKQKKFRNTKHFHKEWEQKILDYFVTPNPDFPAEYWQVSSAVTPLDNYNI
jgi:hypothetical protein